MTLEELSNNIFYWFEGGLNTLIDGSIMQLTIGQAAFTVFVVVLLVSYVVAVIKDLFMD